MTAYGDRDRHITAPAVAFGERSEQAERGRGGAVRAAATSKASAARVFVDRRAPRRRGLTGVSGAARRFALHNVLDVAVMFAFEKQVPNVEPRAQPRKTAASRHHPPPRELLA